MREGEQTGGWAGRRNGCSGWAWVASAASGQRCRPALRSGWCLPGKCALSLAREPIFSQTHTNEFCGIGKSTPQPAGPCDPLRPGRWVYERGGCKLLRGGRRAPSRPRRLSAAAFAGCFPVPFRTSPPSRGALRSAGVPTIAANTTLAPQRSFARHLGRLTARGSTPSAPRVWALWVTGGSPHLFFIAFGGTYQLGTLQG
jgi:hypothetical protein